MLAWERGRGSTKLYPWPWVCDEQELVLTEGELDALNLVARGIPAFTATNGKGKWPDDPPDLSGKVVWVCGDADDAGRKHNETMPAKLYAAGAKEVRVIEWPEGAPRGFDPSDLFARGGTAEEFRAMMDEAETVARPEARVTGEAPDAYFDGSRSVAKRLADQLRGETRFGWMGGELHIYRDGVYVPEGERVVRQRVQTLLGERHSRQRAEEVVYDIKTAAPDLGEQANRDITLVNVPDGLLDWQTGELRSHSPDFVSTIQLPVVFDPEAQGDGTLDRFLQTTLVDGEGHPDNVALVEQFVGYCLVPTTRLEKAFCAIGGGKTARPL